MIQKETILIVADNTGAKKVRCIGILDNSRQKNASIGDRIVVSVITALPNGNVKPGNVFKAIVVRVKKCVRRTSGVYIFFDDNAVVLLDDNGEMKGTRVFGPVARELKKCGSNKIISLAKEVL